MSVAQLNYYNDQELPAAVFDWSAAGYDFSTGWTFSVRLCEATAPTTTVLLKTTGITSTATTITVAWSLSDWSGLAAAVRGTDYALYLYGRQTATGLDIEFSPGRPTTLKLFAAAGTTPVAGTSVVYPWYIGQPINAQTGTTYTLAASDRGGLVTLTNAAATTLTVSTALGLAAGERVDLVQLGAGQVTVAASGVTVNATPGLKLRAQYSAATLLCISAGVYVLVGDLSA